MELSFPVPKEADIIGQFSNKWFNFLSKFRCRQRQNGQRRPSLLMHFGSNLIKEIRETHQLSMEDLSRFSSFVESLEHECMFQIALSFLRYLFFNHSRRPESTVGDFYTELILLSELCSFENASVDRFVKDHIINCFEEKEIRAAFKNFPDLTARDIVEVCSQAEKSGNQTSSDSVLAYLKERQEKLLSSPDQVENEYEHLSFVETPSDVTAMNNGMNISTVFISDHQYTNNIGLDSQDVVEYDSYCFEIVTPTDQLSNLTSSIPDKTSTSVFSIPEAVEGVVKIENVPLNATYYVSHQKEASRATAVIPSAPPPLSVRPCVSLPLKLRSKPKSRAKKSGVKVSRKKVVTSVSTTDVSSSVMSMPTSTPTLTTLPASFNSSTDGCAVSAVESNSFIVGENIVISVFDPNSKNDNACDTTKNQNDISEVSIDPPNPAEPNASQLHMTSIENVISDPEVANEIPSWYCSQQRAVLKTSQILETTGQNIDLYSCNFCGHSCAGKDIMEEHVVQEHKSLKCFVCTMCYTKCASKEQFESHFRIKHLKIEEYQCQTCDMVFNSEDKLFLHIESHTEPVQCRVCNLIFSTEKLLSEHMANVHPDTPRWACNICSSCFPVRKNFVTHMSKVHKVRMRDKVKKSKRFICKICGINFSDKKSSLAHKRKFHWKLRTKQFPCEFCSFVGLTRDKLNCHRRTHTGEKPFICEVCGKGFSQQSYLVKHTRVHTGERPYKCRYCGKAYMTSGCRLNHERRHRNDRPYVCEQCSKNFRTTSELKLHLETHNEFRVKRYQCHCGKAFDTSRNLKRHTLIHTGVKAFKCQLCGSSFSHPDNIREHQKRGVCQRRLLKKKKTFSVSAETNISQAS